MEGSVSVLLVFSGFILIHGPIGFFKKGFQTLPLFWIEGSSTGQGDSHHHPFQLGGFPRLFPDPPEDSFQIFPSGNLLQENGKFIPAIAAEEILPAQRSADSCSRLPKDLIPSRMAIGIIDQFEIIEIQKKDPFPLLSCSQPGFYNGLELRLFKAPVRESLEASRDLSWNRTAIWYARTTVPARRM